MSDLRSESHKRAKQPLPPDAYEHPSTTTNHALAWNRYDDGLIYGCAFNAGGSRTTHLLHYSRFIHTSLSRLLRPLSSLTYHNGRARFAAFHIIKVLRYGYMGPNHRVRTPILEQGYQRL